MLGWNAAEREGVVISLGDGYRPLLDRFELENYYSIAAWVLAVINLTAVPEKTRRSMGFGEIKCL